MKSYQLIGIILILIGIIDAFILPRFVLRQIQNRDRNNGQKASTMRIMRIAFLAGGIFMIVFGMVFYSGYFGQ